MNKRDAVSGLGEKLRAARAAADLTQTQAAEASGVSRVNISGFESEAKTPTLATLYKLAEAYGANVCDLLPGGELGGEVAATQEPSPSPSPVKKGKRKGGG